jgi:predicted transcriptional regulator
MKYRGRTDIVAQILESANGGVTKTRIMYEAYLSYTQLQDYLATLMQNGLIEYSEGEHKYKTTTKGMQFLKAFSQMGKLTGPMATNRE